jgi:hypothetical protein
MCAPFHRYIDAEGAMKTLFLTLLLAGGVSPDVKGRFVSWGTSRESIPYATAVVEFVNTSARTCTVQRYAIHWSQGSYEAKPTDLKLAPNQTLRREVKLTPDAKPTDPVAVVQIWAADCR